MKNKLNMIDVVGSILEHTTQCRSQLLKKTLLCISCFSWLKNPSVSSVYSVVKTGGAE